MDARIDDATFAATGDAETMAAHVALVKHHTTMGTIRAAMGYGASVIFVVVAAILIVFAPESRSTAADIVAAALLVVALSMARLRREGSTR